MKIGVNFHCSDGYISGVEYYALGLLNGLLSIDRENEYVVCTNRPDLVKHQVVATANLMVVPVGPFKTRIGRILWEHWALPHRVAEYKLDVLHCPSYICPCIRTSAPYVVTIHDTLAMDRPRWCKPTNAVYFNLALARSARIASRVMSVSHQSAHDLRRHTSIPFSNIRVVPGGIDERFHPGGDRRRRRRVRRRYRLPERYLLYVGNIEPKKNVSTVLKVQQKLRTEGLDHKLVIAGRRSWKAQTEWKAIACGVASGEVVWAGYVERDDLPYVYQMADVFVFPSLYEGFGFPPLEAMACGTPVVCSARGALAETVADAAMVIEPTDVPRIAAAARGLITDARLRDRYIEKGLRRSRLFTWRRSAEAALSVYREAVADHGR